MEKEKPKMADCREKLTEEEKAVINKGLEDIRAGRVIPHSKAKKLFKKWLSKKELNAKRDL